MEPFTVMCFNCTQCWKEERVTFFLTELQSRKCDIKGFKY